MLIFDTFCFFQEITLLEFRLKYLSPVVDYFIISESNISFSGKPKLYYIEEFWERFKPWHDKIIYIPVEQSTTGLQFGDCESYSPDNGSWILERQQRNALSGVNHMIGNDSIVMVSDLDEFVFTDFIRTLKETPEWFNVNRCISVAMNFNYYFVNNRCVSGPDQIWAGTTITTGKTFKETGPQEMRDNRNSYPGVKAGEHFSFLGGTEAIKNKIRSFAHTEFNRPELLSNEHIEASIANGTDVLGRPGIKFELQPLERYPEDLRKIMMEYPQFIKQI